MLVPTNAFGFPSIVQAQDLELKKLLAHLKYAYLGNNQTLPMIIASELSLGEEEKFLRVLRDHNTALG
jgi:imidazolonepropionase-like amidohydrolase